MNLPYKKYIFASSKNEVGVVERLEQGKQSNWGRGNRGTPAGGPEQLVTGSRATGVGVVEQLEQREQSNWSKVTRAAGVGAA
jgi:hypothetical protein